LPKNTPLSPCGVLAKYVFTDSFSLYLKNKDSTVKSNETYYSETSKLKFPGPCDRNSSQVAIVETNISNPYDRSFKFNKAEDTLQWLDVTNGKCPNS